MNWGALDWSILGPALLAGLLVLATHVPLGMQVLDRGIVFIDLAIAQVAGLGVIVAQAAGFAERGIALQGAAVVAALLGAALLTWTEQRAAQYHEAFIGVLFVLAACVGILVLAGNPHGGEHLKDLLVGQILWVSGTQLMVLACVSAALPAWCARWPPAGWRCARGAEAISRVRPTGWRSGSRRPAWRRRRACAGRPWRPAAVPWHGFRRSRRP